VARVSAKPLSSHDLEMMRRERGGGIHCKKEWFDENVKELVEEGILADSLNLYKLI